MELKFKCCGCGKNLEIFEGNSIPVYMQPNPSFRMPSGGALRYCDKCYKNETGESFNELLKTNQGEENKLKQELKVIKEKYKLEFDNIVNLEIGTNVNIIGTISSKEFYNEIQKEDRKLRLAKFVIEDDSGNVILILWNDKIDKIGIGSRYLIKNGYVSEWGSEKQVTLGMVGEIYAIK